MLGGLRSETRAARSAVAGEDMTSDPASIAAVLVPFAGLEDDVCSSLDSDSSSDRTTRKRRRLVRRSNSTSNSNSRATGRSTRQPSTQKQWLDDGCAASFASRLEAFHVQCRASLESRETSFYNRPEPRSEPPTPQKQRQEIQDEDHHPDDQEEEESTDFYTPDTHVIMDCGLAIPTYMLAHLYPHQKQCLAWLHHLHERNTGGILGDDMGLGKTVQIATFLGAMMHATRIRTTLLLCPASVLLQWVREFHKWCPLVRVVLLHSSGTGVVQANQTYAQLIDSVVGAAALQADDGSVVLSTYENVRQYQELFLDVEWDYVVLDEGHRIRNPDAEITLVCKQLKTVHRLILTGTPIQNRLRELWSLFDFVYPGKLGTLPTFDDEFVLPIRTGGYANASKMQVVMAYKCALALRTLIDPYLLRRTKKEVQEVTRMPAKMEQIVFCNLTSQQTQAYVAFLASPEAAKVLRREIRPFRAISILRHICNHPDLLTSMKQEPGLDTSLCLISRDSSQPYGYPEASGKMLVLQKILVLWKQQGHRVLLFTQTRKMLDILESLMSQLSYTHCRLDGTTSVKERQSLLDAFNREDSDIFIFLLTTRAGGIGVNLTGADRVVIFDPDWNPSTDLQARERSWRIGQTKPVTIYRLITSGTIEEKIYHRQIYKQYLTTKVLHDAKRKRTFNRHTLRDLFVLNTSDGTSSNDQGQTETETTDIFVDGRVERPGKLEEGKVDDDVELDSDNGSGSDEETKEDDAQSVTSATDDGDHDNDAILKNLFDGAEVRGVFNHDVIESDGIQNQEADLIELESTKIAQSALSALRASRALVRGHQSTVTTLTWTGRHGVAGDPTQRATQGLGLGSAVGRRPQLGIVNTNRPISTPASNPFAQSALSSREMLTRIKNRKNGIASRGDSVSTPVRFESTGFVSVDVMTKQLFSFLRSRANHGNGVSTEQVLDAFATVVAPKNKLVFRHLLRDMAICKSGKWVLKPDYADPNE